MNVLVSIMTVLFLLTTGVTLFSASTFTPLAG
jgi:hypothetical protein